MKIKTMLALLLLFSANSYAIIEVVNITRLSDEIAQSVKLLPTDKKNDCVYYGEYNPKTNYKLVKINTITCNNLSKKINLYAYAQGMGLKPIEAGTIWWIDK